MTSHESRVHPCSLLMLVVLMPLTCGGCTSSEPDLRLVPVTGTVTFNGKALADYQLTFQPESGRPCLATTDAKGQYEIFYQGDWKGAPAGKYRVTLQNIPADDKGFSSEAVAVMQKYGDGSKDAPRVEVVGPGPQVIDLKLN